MDVPWPSPGPIQPHGDDDHDHDHHADLGSSRGSSRDGRGNKVGSHDQQTKQRRTHYPALPACVTPFSARHWASSPTTTTTTRSGGQQLDLSGGAPTVVMSCSNNTTTRTTARNNNRFAYHLDHNRTNDDRHHHNNASATNTAASSYEERLASIERQLQKFDSNVALRKRLTQLEQDMQQRDVQLAKMQAQLQEWQDWESQSVSWTISAFEKRLTSERHFFESSTFTVGTQYPFKLTVCVLEVPDTVPEAKRPVAIFIKSALHHRPRQQQRQKSRSNHREEGAADHPEEDDTHTHTSASSSVLFPIRLDGSSITLVGRRTMHNKTILVGEKTLMEDPSQGKGVRQFTTLGTLRDSFLQMDASVVVRATVRVPRIQTCSLQTLS